VTPLVALWAIAEAPAQDETEQRYSAV